ncbi:MAG: exodeoxyribonuclease VII small subunit [Deltaproteobacteria bacterium]|nr:exodeoxyribonuclease VII small subunit [Deltaproteobacteria bacterium]
MTRLLNWWLKGARLGCDWVKKGREKDESVEHFDQLLERLRSIVERIEHGGLSLEESLRLFEEGIGVSRRLFEILDRSEGRVEELMATMEKTPFTRGEE